MSTFVDVVALAGGIAALVVVVLLVRLALAPRAVSAPVDGTVGEGRPPSAARERDWSVFGLQVLPAIVALGLAAIIMPLLAWGLALHRANTSDTVFWVGAALVALAVLTSLHTLRRSRSDR